MAIQDQKEEMEKDQIRQDIYRRWEGNHTRGKIFGGLIVILIGCVFFAREMGFFLPHWLFTWPMFLIVLGIYIGLKHAFQNSGWIFLILIGGIFLIRENIPDFEYARFLMPGAIILIGIAILFKPKKKFIYRNERYAFRHFNRMRHGKNWEDDAFRFNRSVTDEYLDTVSVFGSIKKNIISKDFKGGEVVAVFGGVEINLMQADIHGHVVLEVNQVFGGTKLIVPPHWEIKSELAAVLGSVEDKRPLRNDNATDGTKVLVLKGTTIFGGIDIKSY
jgi:predicted membrane protein